MSRQNGCFPPEASGPRLACPAATLRHGPPGAGRSLRLPSSTSLRGANQKKKRRPTRHPSLPSRLSTTMACQGHFALAMCLCAAKLGSTSTLGGAAVFVPEQASRSRRGRLPAWGTIFLLTGMLLGGCAGSQPLSTGFAGPAQAVDAERDPGKKTWASKVLTTTALERVTGRKPDPSRLNELN